MGTALNYRRDALERFVLSCRTAVPEATLVLFTSGISGDTIAWLRDEGVTVVPSEFNRTSTLAGRALVLHQFRLSLAARFCRIILRLARCPADQRARAIEAMYSVVTQRFYRYATYLRTWQHRFTHVFLGDIRDIVFQSSPFPCEGLHVFAEDERIDQSHFAKRWFTLSYGPGSWRPIGDRPLLNVGTVLGDTRSVLAYVDAMCAEFDRRLPFFWGADTAMHNHLVHQHRVAAQVHEFGDGPAINLNAIDLARLRVTQGELLDIAGRPYPIVHQYDRVHGLALTAGQRIADPGRPAPLT